MYIYIYNYNHAHINFIALPSCFFGGLPVAKDRPFFGGGRPLGTGAAPRGDAFWRGAGVAGPRGGGRPAGAAGEVGGGSPGRPLGFKHGGFQRGTPKARWMVFVNIPSIDDDWGYPH